MEHLSGTIGWYSEPQPWPSEQSQVNPGSELGRAHFHNENAQRLCAENRQARQQWKQRERRAQALLDAPAHLETSGADYTAAEGDLKLCKKWEVENRERIACQLANAEQTQGVLDEAWSEYRALLSKIVDSTASLAEHQRARSIIGWPRIVDDDPASKTPTASAVRTHR